MSEALALNTNISHYRIVSKLGAGGMGEVYLAQDTKLDRNVALKILPSEVAFNHDRMERFVREAKATAALNHPNIAHIYEIGEQDETHFIAMEFIDGQTLGELIHHSQTDLAKLLRHLQHVAEGLAKAHGAGIVHRDLKPDNIMVSRDGHAKILDFGLAKLIEASGPGLDNSEDSSAPTHVMQQRSVPGMVMGTIGYMSPEQAQGKINDIDQRSDIFSFGCILFEAVTGRRAFAGEDSIDTLNQIIREPAPPITDFRPDAPNHLQRIIRRCLAKDRDDRYQTIKDVAIELRELRHEIAESGVDVTIAPRTETTIPDPDFKRGGVQTASAAGVVTGPVSSAEYLVSGLKRHKIATAVCLLLLVAIAVGAGFYLHARNTEVAIESIAVLPFENRSNDADADYLSDGLAESLVYRLSQLPNLKVSPTSSVMRYKGRDGDVSAIASALGVNAVMTGRMVKRGDNLTISAELIDARYNKLLWGEQYERKMSELLATQREIAAEITNKLRLKLSGTDEAKVAKNYTASPEAYELYLKGRFYWNKRSEENLRKAIEQFKAATEKDPHFALAYVGLADSLGVLPYFTRASKSEMISQAKAYATRALEIDASLAEAHASLGLINRYSWQWAEAEKELKRAIELNPNYATARHWYSRHLRTVGRHTEALAQIKQAHEADPLSLVISINLAENLAAHGDLNGAIEQCRLIIELDPNYWDVDQTLAFAYLKLGRKDEALAQVQKAVELSNRSSISLKSLGYVQAMAGKRNEALAVLRELEERYAKQQADGRDIAVVYAGLGEKDKAFAWLEKDFQAHDSSLADIGLEPALDSLRDDSRFKDLTRRMGIPVLE